MLSRSLNQRINENQPTGIFESPQRQTEKELTNLGFLEGSGFLELDPILALNDCFSF